MITVQPVVLEGKVVRLVPLSLEHEDDLVEAGVDEEVAQYLPIPLTPRVNLHHWLETSLDSARAGTELPFAIIDCANGRAIGSTRVLDIRPEHDAVEVGYTWYGKIWWRTSVNTECKYLVLRHLFEDVGCKRVTLKTDALNVRSRRAIERLGAVHEGVLRKHMIVQNGRNRDSAYYSILDDEWPAVKTRLEGFLSRTSPIA